MKKIVAMALCALPFFASAQAPWPEKPVRIIIAAAAGGSTDAVTRMIAAELTKRLGQSVVAEYRPGASGMIATEAVARSPGDGYTFLADHAYYTLRDHFKVQSLDGFGCAEMPAAQCAAGAIVNYLKELRRSLSHITRLAAYRNSQFMIVDAATQANLELVVARGGGRDTSLLGCLDRTHTPMGARKLRDWILHPLCDLAALHARQELIGRFIAEPFILGNLRETLKGIRDLERTIGRLTQTGGNARDLQVLRTSLEQIPQLRTDLESLLRGPDALVTSSAPTSNLQLAASIHADLHALPHIVELLTKAIVDEPPAMTKEGGIFREGYHAPLDELRNASRAGKDWIAQLQQKTIEETGIKSLKIRYTSVFGYFIEVTKSNLSSVPPTWHRKQTVANGERFITPELKEVESKILGADERSQALEYELFLQLRDEVLRELVPLQATASAVATLDVLAGLAETSRLFGYCRPQLSDELRIRITDGRHPVLDQSLVEEKFVPNDTALDDTANRGGGLDALMVEALKSARDRGAELGR